MPTYQFVETAVPLGVGVASITMDASTRADIAIAQIPSLQAWFDPSVSPPYTTGSTAEGFLWRDKRKGVLARSSTTSRPAASTINGAPALSFGADGVPATVGANGALLIDDVPLLRSPNFGIIFGAELLVAAQGVLIGSALSASVFSFNIDSSGRIAVNLPGLGVVVRPATDYRGQRVVVVLGYTQTGGVLTMRVNGTQVGQATGVSYSIASQRLKFGGVGAPGSNASPLFNSRIGQALFFSEDPTASARAAQLARVESRLRGLYGL